ncbi:MAG: NAD(P)H-binding protein [Oscillibacter sp.]|nr:NAD(P)H-binding protein [Oscillibacter sp.]
MKKLAITGITGKNGKYLFQHLVQNETLVLEAWAGIRLNIRDKKKADFIEKAGTGIPLEYVVGDLSEPAVAEQLLQGCDTLLHIAGIHKSPAMVRAAVKQGVQRLILVHTTGVYSKYKRAGEEYRKIDDEVYRLVKESNIALTILRPTMIYGTTTDKNISVFIKMVDKLKIMPTVNGARYELQPVHCADLGKAFYQVLMSSERCNGKDYILSGGAPIELRRIFEEIAKNLGVKRCYVSCPFPIAYAGAWTIYLFTRGKKDLREKVQRLCEPRVFSYEAAANDFGYAPMTFQEGIIQEVRDYLAEKEGLIRPGEI